MQPYEEMFNFIRHYKFLDTTPTNLTVRTLDTGSRLIQVHGRYFLVWDNGGEVGVELLNHATMRFFPLTRFGVSLSPGTLAYRLRMVLCDEPIDYDFIEDVEVDEILRALS